MCATFTFKVRAPTSRFCDARSTGTTTSPNQAQQLLNYLLSP